MSSKRPMRNLQPWARRLAVRLTQLAILVAFVAADIMVPGGGAIGILGIFVALAVGFVAGRLGLTRSDPIQPKPYATPLRELPQPWWSRLLWFVPQLGCVGLVVFVWADIPAHQGKPGLGITIGFGMLLAFTLTILLMGLIEIGRRLRDWHVRRSATELKAGVPAASGRGELVGSILLLITSLGG